MKNKRYITLAAVLALLAVLVMPMGALAADGVTVVSGATGTYYTIIVPGAIDLPQLSVVGSVSSTLQTVKTETNDGTMTKVKVDAIGTDTVSPGNLGRGNRGGTADNEVLSPVLTGTSANLGWTANSALSSNVVGTKQTLTSGKYTATDVVITQGTVTAPSPLLSGTYTAKITFTATFTTL